MFDIKEEYKNASYQYTSIIDDLDKLEEARLKFNKNLVKKLSKKYFGNDIEFISYTDDEGLDNYGDNDYIFKIFILSKEYLQSNYKQRLDDNLRANFETELRENIIFNYKADHLQLNIDTKDYRREELKYYTNILE